MPAAFTSRIALASLENELSGLRLEVYTAIRSWPANPGPSIEDLATTLGRKESSICGRINELREAGAIEDAPIKTSPTTGKPQKTYRALVYREPDPTAKADNRGNLLLPL